MEKLFTNIIVGTDNILQTAVILEEHLKTYHNLAKEEVKKVEQSKEEGGFYVKKYIDATLSYTIEFYNNESVTKTNDFDWFKDSLLSNVQNIKEVRLHYYVYMEEISQSVDVNFEEKRVDIYSTSKNIGGNDVAHEVESYLNSLSHRYNDIIKKQERRKFIPSFSFSLGIAVVMAIIFFFLARFGVFGFTFHKVFLGFLSMAILLGIAFVFGLLITSKNRKLYRDNIKFEKYYAGYDSNYKSVYKDDIEKYKNECEVCIGNNASMPIVRMDIEQNYKKSLKIVYVELIIAVVATILFFVI